MFSRCFPLLFTQNTGHRAKRHPAHSRRTPGRAKPTWSQMERHFLWEQLLLAPLLVLFDLGEASGVHDVIRLTAPGYQLCPGVAADGVGLPLPSEILARSGKREEKRGGPTQWEWCGVTFRVS